MANSELYKASKMPLFAKNFQKRPHLKHLTGFLIHLGSCTNQLPLVRRLFGLKGGFFYCVFLYLFPLYCLIQKGRCQI